MTRRSIQRLLVWSGALAVVGVIGFVLYLRSLGLYSWAPVYATGDGAIDGYDVVAYFTVGQPLKGSQEIVHEWQGARWHFINEEHRALFAADPERYAPQFGGYCAYAVGHGYTARSSPEAWLIDDGRLYLNFDQDVSTQWKAQKTHFIEQARNRWSGVLLGR